MSSEEESTGPVIRDRRRIDPATGKVREPAQSGSPRGAGAPLRGGPGQARPGRQAADGQAAAQERLAERTADLQRLQAEYANYRKRVERDRVAVREQALANVLAGLLPVLDDIGRAREHEELSGGFKSVAESLETTVAKLGLERFGENGEPFDPKVHEALMHSYSNDVTEPTCVQILQPGYRVGERILRPARVAVAEPGEAGEPEGPEGLEGPEGPDDGPGRTDRTDGPGGPGNVHHQPGGAADGTGGDTAGDT